MNLIPEWHSKLILDIFHIVSQEEALRTDQRRFEWLNETHPEFKLWSGYMISASYVCTPGDESKLLM
jgi:hypothetical protein